MSKSDEYLAKAAEMRRLAQQAADPKVRETYANLAETWERLGADAHDLDHRSREKPPDG